MFISLKVFELEWRFYTLSASKGNNIVIQRIQSGDDDYLMNETRKSTSGAQCPTLFDKCHGIFSGIGNFVQPQFCVFLFNMSVK